MTNVNPVTKNKVDRDIKRMANDIKAMMGRCSHLSAFLEGLTAEKMTEIGYDATDQAYISSFRVAMNNIVLMYQNQDKVGTDNPQYFIEFMSDALVY